MIKPPVGASQLLRAAFCILEQHNITTTVFACNRRMICGLIFAYMCQKRNIEMSFYTFSPAKLVDALTAFTQMAL